MRREELLSLLKKQMRHEERETEIYARKVQETEHGFVKLVYAKLMRDSMHHADVLNSAVTYMTKREWESSPLKESCNELLRLMNVEEEALGLFTRASTQVTDLHLKSLFTMLALDEEQHYAMLRYKLGNFVDKKEKMAA